MLLSGGCLAESMRLVILRAQSIIKQAVGEITVLLDAHYDSLLFWCGCLFLICVDSPK